MELRDKRDLRMILVKHLGEKCVQCAGTVSLELDHKIPIAIGGKERLENLQILCKPCHRSKTSQDIKLIRKSLKRKPKSKKEGKIRGIGLPLPEELFSQIKEMAANEHRSINAQILTILSTFLDKQGEKTQ